MSLETLRALVQIRADAAACRNQDGRAAFVSQAKDIGCEHEHEASRHRAGRSAGAERRWCARLDRNWTYCLCLPAGGLATYDKCNWHVTRQQHRQTARQRAKFLDRPSEPVGR